VGTTADDPGPEVGETSAGAGLPGTAPSVEPTAAPVEGRQARRASRRLRRRLSIGCVVLITACVVITVLIVGIARDRAPAPQVVLTAVGPTITPGGTTVSNHPPLLSAPFLLFRSVHSSEQGAEAPPGGNP
jgi:hypothetical protein